MSQGRKKKQGTVYLVGAGPGELGLLTLRGMELLGEADAVVYDWLVNSKMLSFCADAEKYYVGKNISRKKKNSWSEHQKQINRLVVKLAKQGKQVVRLKGGDPFVFGRASEEIAYLKTQGILFEVVPGISAGIAGPAYAGIPVTDRNWASSVTFVTGQERAGKNESSVDWKALVQTKGTLVIFMGVAKLPHITRTLMRHGKPKTTRVSVIEKATHPDQRVVEGNLANIVQRVKNKKIQPPALIVVGHVNECRRRLKWFEGRQRLKRTQKTKRSLIGKNVLVTRASSQASSLRRLLENKGANVLEFPSIRTVAPRSFTRLDQALKSLGQFDWIVFTSVNAVESVLARVSVLRKDARIFAGIKIAVIGNATAELLKAKGLRPDFMPKKFTTEALVKELKKQSIKGKRFLLPRTDIAPEFLQTELTKHGALTTQVIAYRTLGGYRKPEITQLKKWFDAGVVDFITFTSSSTVQNFMKALPKPRRKTLQKRSRIISIGPVTTQTLKTYGLRPDAEASEHTIPGLVTCLSAS